jgi:predicted glycosyltransferase
VKVWIDIDNPPQTRYLLPLARSFEGLGCETLLTARASESTLSILESEGAAFHRVGSSFGKGSLRKVRGVVGRTRQLTAFLSAHNESPDFVIAGSRPSALAAMWLGIPSFVILDYEHVNLAIYRFARCYVSYPDVISGAGLAARGLSRERLLPFPGLKEDFTFANVDLAAVAPHRFESGTAPVRLLVRPPAEESHYYRSESRELTVELLRYLAKQNVTVVLVPRYDWQMRYLDEVGPWTAPPIVLKRPVPVVALLKAVDAVVSAGGTMLREAAFLGIPAYSTFRSKIGAVDRDLASIGRLSLLASPADFSNVRLERHRQLAPLREDAAILEHVSEMIVRQAAAARFRERAVSGARGYRKRRAS